MKQWNIPRAATGQPVEFEVNGEQFKVYGPLPGLPLMELAVAIDGADDGPAGQAEQAATAAWGRFMFAILGPEPYDRFRKVCLRDAIPPESIMEMGSWIIEEVSGAPLEQHSSSPQEPQPSTHPSTVPPPLPAHQTR